MPEFDEKLVDLKNQCPQCRTDLQKVTKGDFDTWECPAGHGIGLTLTEAWGHLQDDEIHSIWAATKVASEKSALKSPAIGMPMVAITVVFDDDEVEGNQGPGAHPVTLDVAPDEQFLWFHVEDKESAALDLPNPEPSPEELAKIEQIRQQFGASILETMRERNGLTNQSASYRFATKEAAELHIQGLLDKMGGAKGV